MPCTMKAEIQHNIVTAAHNFIKASILLEDLCDDDIPLDDLDNDYMEDAELLELAGVMTLQLAMEMDGDGTRGAYNQFPKSNDWFPASLQQPDRWFRSNYRMSRDMFDHLVYILAQNQIFYSPKKRQRHIKFQLATFLICYGQRSSPVLDAASKLGLGFETAGLENWKRKLFRTALKPSMASKIAVEVVMGAKYGWELHLWRILTSF
ncbi:MAG: hypothetical protein NXY57DRAFT_1043852 [Lentinula lateritia]|nr:MAG: hypothetical protein NXY57DRAFT_1043852 [Lentinula lateritia]